jgi:two-component system response regulator YesN
MNMATNLLKNPNISISSIAAEVGYSNYSYFVSTFKKIYGLTPTQYREKLL